MSLPKAYNKALRSHANFYAAWFPVTAPYKVGDYGLIQRGVFEKIGTLEDLRDDGFSVEVRTTPGPPSSIDFRSSGVQVIKTVAGASAPVPNLPAANVDAKITFEFTKENSSVVKAATLTVEQMDNIHQVAEELARLRREKKWSHRYRVVSGTYTGENCLVMLSGKAGTQVELVAKASTLRQLDLGNVEVKPSISSSSENILKSVGNTGLIGLKLFKLKRISLFGNYFKTLAEVGLSDEERAIEDDWGEDLEDDQW